MEQWGNGNLSAGLRLATGVLANSPTATIAGLVQAARTADQKRGVYNQVTRFFETHPEAVQDTSCTPRRYAGGKIEECMMTMDEGTRARWRLVLMEHPF